MGQPNKKPEKEKVLAAISTDENDFMSVPTESLPVGTVLPYPIYLKIGEKFVLFRKKDDIVTQPRIDDLMQRHVDAAYILKKDWDALIQTLETISDDACLLPETEECAKTVRNILYTYWKKIEERKVIEEKLFVSLKNLSDKMQIAIKSNPKLADKLLRRYKEGSLYFANHNVNIAVYSIILGIQAKLNDEDLKDLSLAASVANIGNIRISREILYKPKRLDVDEREIIKTHPTQGKEILATLLVSPRISQAVEQHSEWANGKGYPNGLKLKDIGKFARIIAIAEVYSALTSVRPWGAQYPPANAIDMMSNMGGRFDPNIFQVLNR